MKIHEVKRYECEVCHGTYATKGEALRCDAQPISQDMGVKVGDIVRVTRSVRVSIDIARSLVGRAS